MRAKQNLFKHPFSKTENMAEEKKEGVFGYLKRRSLRAGRKRVLSLFRRKKRRTRRNTGRAMAKAIPR